MFLGTIPADLRAHVAATCSTWHASEIHVACSGLFTIERSILAANPDAHLHSSDITLFTTAIGHWASGKTEPIPVTASNTAAFAQPYLDEDALSSAAAILVLSAFADSLGKTGRWHHRQTTAHTEQFPGLHERTVAKLIAAAKRGFKIDTYTAADMTAHLDNREPCVLFPPTYHKGYEAMFRGLDAHLDWDAPDYVPYNPQSPEQVQGLIEQVTDRPYWMIGFDTPHPDLDPWLVGIVQPTPRSHPIWTYANNASTAVSLPRQRTEPVYTPRHGEGDPIGDLKLHPVTPGQFNTLRSQYLDTKIRPSIPAVRLAVTSGGKIIGGLGYDLVVHNGGQPHKDLEAYLLADFAVRPTDQPRLSRLVVAAALSTEAQAICERRFGHRIHTVTTAAFTDKPASMKYRWSMKAVKRTETPEAEHRWELLYRGPAGKWTLADALDQWKRTQEVTPDDTAPDEAHADA